MEVKKDHKDSPFPLFETTPFHFEVDSDEIWVELFQIVDDAKFQKWYDLGTKDSEKESCVRFSESATVQMIDNKGSVGKVTEVRLTNDQDSVNSEIDVSHFGDHGESQQKTKDKEEEPNSDIEDDSKPSDASEQDDQSLDGLNSKGSTSEVSVTSDTALGRYVKNFNSNTRVSNITSEIMQDAVRATVNTNTNGGGPKQDE